MEFESPVIIGLGLVALLVVWLVFSMIRKMIGLLFVAGIAIAGAVLWNNPDLRDSLIAFVLQFVGSGAAG